MSTSFSDVYVDLDGTLIKTDMLFESVLLLLTQNIFYVFLLPLWLLKGKAKLKYEVAKRVDISPELLPYNQEVIEHINSQKILGKNIYLATATNIKLAKQIADHVGVFDQCLASSEYVNLSSKTKLEEIQKHSTQFEYMGNSKDDLVIFAESASAILVSSSRKLAEQAKKKSKSLTIFNQQNNSIFKQLLKAFRIHQWSKNVLLFIPLLLSSQLLDIGQLSKVVGAFFCFGLLASGTYVLNDLFDLWSDRQHPRKKKRPFASGELTIITGGVVF